MAKLRVGVLGIGEMGRRHVENLRTRVSNATLVAVADVNEAHARRIAAEFEIDHAFGSLEAMLERQLLDAIVIATPDAFHAHAIRLAAAADKHILCEKPIALSVGDAMEAIAAARNAGVLLQIGFMRRYDPAYVAAKQRIEGGEIGEPILIKAIGRDKDPPPIGAYSSGVNGMLFYTNSIHDFDVARWLMEDEVTQVQACTTIALRPELARYGDVVASLVNLTFRRGAIGNIESASQAGYGYDVRTEVLGSRGSVFIGGLQQVPMAFLSADGQLQQLCDHFLTRYADAYLAEVRDWVDTILADRPPRVTGEDGLRALAIAAAAERSHIEQRACAVAVHSAEAERATAQIQ